MRRPCRQRKVATCCGLWARVQHSRVLPYHGIYGLDVRHNSAHLPGHHGRSRKSWTCTGVLVGEVHRRLKAHAERERRGPETCLAITLMRMRPLRISAGSSTLSPTTSGSGASCAPVMHDQVCLHLILRSSSLGQEVGDATSLCGYRGGGEGTS